MIKKKAWYNKGMGRKKFILAGLLLMIGAGLIGSGEAVFAGVNDFDFSDFTGDYYLSKDAEGISHLKVKESVVAEFPDLHPYSCMLPAFLWV